MTRRRTPAEQREFARSLGFDVSNLRDEELEKLTAQVAQANLDAVLGGPDGEIPVDARVQFETGRMMEFYGKYCDE